MTRKPFFGGNWKMHKTPDESRAYCREFKTRAAALLARADVALLAPFIDLEAMRGEVHGFGIGYGAQDCYWEPRGAFTGEISADMLKELGATHCIVGHSERRQLFGETDEMVAKKVSALLRVDVVPIVCVGESLQQHQAGETRGWCERQVRDSLGHLNATETERIIIAYEPIWAIGTGLSDDPENANGTIACIRAAIPGLQNTRILYGGSMKVDNAAAFCAQPEIDGGLVGSASLDAMGFADLIARGVGVARPT